MTHLLTALLALATGWTAHHWHTHRETAAAAERAARPARRPIGFEDGVIRVALAAACCETWWTSAGAEHDPHHCTRKDTTA